MRRLDSEQPNLRAVLAWDRPDQQPPDKMIRLWEMSGSV
jgi:hypothetical protein